MDDFRIFMGEDFVVNDSIRIRQPKLREVVEMGEQAYWGVISIFTMIPSDIKAPLWGAGVDWEKLSDFDLFITLVKTASLDRTRILFGDLDFTKFVPIRSPQTGDTVLYEPERKIIIDEPIHHKIVEFFKVTHCITKKRDIAGNENTKTILIELNRSDLEDATKSQEKSYMRQLVSSMILYPGFDYGYQTILDITYFQLMDAVQRSQIYTSTIALMQGAYSGMCDVSKINKSKFDWMRAAI